MGESERDETLPSAKRKRCSSVDSKTLLSEDAIIARSLPVGTRSFCGVYFLILGDEIVYVGGTKNLLGRLSTHLAKRRMNFNRVAFVLCEENDIWKIELAYITTFNPLYNRFNTTDADRRQRLTVQRQRAQWDHGSYVLTRDEAATYLEQRGITLGDCSLGYMAHLKKGPVYYRVPHGSAVYFKKDLDAWADTQLAA